MTLRSPVQFQPSALPGNDSGQVVHTRASVTKQYNLVHQRVVMLSGWEGNRKPGGKYWQPTTWFMTMSRAS